MRLRLRALDRKMLRELWRLRGQLLSIGLVVSSGVMTVVTMRGSYESLVVARDRYYADYHLADVWSSLERAPEPIRERLGRIPGVVEVSTRVSGYATLDLPWLDAPGMGLFVSMPADRRPSLNDIHVVQGRYLAPGRSGEVVVSEGFFLENALQMGDTVRAVLNGRRHELRIVGVAISPEHSYAVPPGALYPEDDRYGIFWMSRDELGPNLDLDEAFNEVALALSPRADRDEVIEEVDRILDPYGGRGAYGREDQFSYKILEDELAQDRTTGTVIPAVFLGVAAFLLNLVLGRLIATQRTEIGALKSFGYTDREVGWHYLSYSLVAVGIGTLLGAAGGVWAGDALVELYGEYFRFPVLEHRLSWTLVLLGGMTSLVAAAVGGLASVRHAVSLPPAEAMRPEPPPRFRPGWIERAGIGSLLPTWGRLILRNLERRPLRALLSSLGVAFSVAILVIGMFMFDGVDRMMEVEFQSARREDLSVSFNREVGPEVVVALAALDGVTRVEPLHQLPVRISAGHRERELTLTGLPPDGTLRRIVAVDRREHPLPLEGVVISRWLARALAVEPGDAVTVEMLTGRRRTAVVPVAGTVEDILGISAVMSLGALERLTGEGPRVSSALLTARPEARDSLNATLKRAPLVAGVASPAAMYTAFQERLDESLLVSVTFILVFAAIISVAVIYNGTRIALSERGRELASLRVLGFTKREVATLLFGEQAAITLLAIPIGCAIGYALALLVVTAMASETYRIPMVVTSRTYLWAAAVTVIAALASAALVRRRLDRMDLIAVLKTRE